MILKSGRLAQRVSVGLVLFSLALGACSSSTRSHRGGQPLLRSPGQRAPAAEATRLATPTTEAEKSSKTAGTDLASSGSSGGSRGGPATAGSRPAKSRRLPVGVTASTVKVGIWFLLSTDACAALGIQPGSSGQCGAEEENEYQAVVDWVNANGGVAGRKLEPVFYRTSTGGSSYAAQAQAACSYFVEDQKVYMVVSEGQVGRQFMAHCLARNHKSFIEPGFYPFDAPEYRQLEPYIFQPNRARPERWVRSYIDGLHAQGFFARGTRIGLLRFDAAPYDRITKGVLKPRLAHYGLRLTDEAIISLPPSVSSYGDMGAQLSSAILQFKRDEVDRVIFFADLGEMQTVYFPEAESQDFHPIYGLSSIDWAGHFSSFAPKAQMHGAVGVGWLPAFDVAAGQDPGGSRAATRCMRILAKAGEEPAAGRSNRCDTIFFLKTMLDRAASLTPLGLREAVERLDGRFEPSASFSTQFGPGRYDGPASYRYFYFDDSCTCTKYRGSLHPLP